MTTAVWVPLYHTVLLLLPWPLLLLLLLAGPMLLLLQQWLLLPLPCRPAVAALQVRLFPAAARSTTAPAPAAATAEGYTHATAAVVHATLQVTQLLACGPPHPLRISAVADIRGIHPAAVAANTGLIVSNRCRRCSRCHDSSICTCSSTPSGTHPSIASTLSHCMGCNRTGIPVATAAASNNLLVSTSSAGCTATAASSVPHQLLTP